MSREQLVEEAIRVAKAAEHNIRWIWENPDRIDLTKRDDMMAYLCKMRRFAKQEMKNARRAGRTLRRTRYHTSFLMFILTHFRLKHKV